MEGTYFDMRKVIILALAGGKNRKIPVKITGTRLVFGPRMNDVFFPL